jgi:hypothetical protein
MKPVKLLLKIIISLLQKEDRTFPQTVKRRFNKTSLQYKVVSPTRIYPRFNTERAISLIIVI